jgi:hypothetical protein
METKTVNLSKIERAGTIAAGVVLAASGINNMLKSPCLLLAKCLAGYHLIQMGKTGHSPVNAWLEINTADLTPREAFETYRDHFIGAFAAPDELVEAPAP